MSVNSKMTAIADKLRGYTGKSEKLNLDQMAAAVDEVNEMGFISGEAAGIQIGYNDGYEEGHTDGYEEGHTIGYEEGFTEGEKVSSEESYTAGYDQGWGDGWQDGWYSGVDNGWIDGVAAGRAEGREEGIAEGRQAEYDEFWDLYQDYGNRRNYSQCFAGRGWQNATSKFKPKYPIIVSGNASSHSSMFYLGPSGDLTQILSDCGVYLDTSGVTEFDTMFYTASFSRIPVIDTRGATAIKNLFMSNNIKIIDRVILRDDGSQTFINGSFNTSNLNFIQFEGVIGNDITFAACKGLSKLSINNILSVLSSETTDRTLTLSKQAVDVAYETTPGAMNGSTNPFSAWLLLVAQKSNWNISLV